KYTIAFGKDGRVSARIDCNRGSGTWKTSGGNQLQFGPIASSRTGSSCAHTRSRMVIFSWRWWLTEASTNSSQSADHVRLHNTGGRARKRVENKSNQGIWKQKIGIFPIAGIAQGGIASLLLLKIGIISIVRKRVLGECGISRCDE